jgi:hypothetical protein
MLAKHSLATVTGVSEDRTIISSSYPSEPVLAEASARYTADKTMLRKVLEQVQAAFHNENKMLDPPRGDVGEMCAAALLGYAMDHVRQSSGHTYMSQTVPLRKLLLLFDYGPSGIDSDETIKAIVGKWNVNFTHFVRPSYLGKDDLKAMWMRRMAFYVPNGVRGLDLLIAMWDQTEEKFGTLRVQVKNYSNKITRSESKGFLNKLLPSKCPPQVDNESFSVGLLLSVNGIDQSCQLLSGPGHTPCGQDQGNQEPLENPVLQLTTCFPCDKEDSPLNVVSKQLMRICSQNTAVPLGIVIDPSCEWGE